MHQHALGPDRVERVIWKRLLLRIAHVEGYRQCSAGSAADCLRDEGFTEIYSRNMAFRTDSFGEIERICSDATAEVQRLHPQIKTQGVENGRFPFDDSWNCIRGVEEAEEKNGSDVLSTVVKCVTS